VDGPERESREPPPAVAAEAAAAAEPTETLGETPQTASMGPGPAVSPGRDGTASRKTGLSPRMRIALALAGGAALVAAIVVPRAVGSTDGGASATAVASAAAVAGTAAGALAVRDDGGLDAAPEVAEEARPVRPTVWRVARLADDPTVTLVDGVMARRPLLAALGAAGLAHGEAQRIARSLEDVRDIDRFGLKDTFTVARDKADGHVVAYEIASSPSEVWQAHEEPLSDGTNKLVARKLDLPSERVRVKKALVVGSDLRASFTDAGLTPIDDVLSMLDDALEGHAELADIRAGARLRLVATQERVDGVFARWASLDAVEYFPASAAAPAVRVYLLGGDEDRRHDRRGWFDAKGRQPYHGGWRSPVPMARIASRFNPHRMHPVLHVLMPHNGVDFASPVGTPVYATAPGVVQSAGNGGPCGNMVAIAHAGGITSVYCHLSRFAAGLHPGQRVEGRQLIAYVGQTGRVTGPHLHFGIKKNGVFIDPMTLRLDGVRVVPRGRREEFDHLRAALDGELDSIPLPVAGGPPPPDSPEPAEGETFFEEAP
jgi:murein DD-endopeptidase MepM/ murein hydrolase activator NlpD